MNAAPFTSTSLRTSRSSRRSSTETCRVGAPNSVILPRFKSWSTVGVSALIALTGVSVAAPARLRQAPTGIHKIQHVVVIMQENRTFDNYFGTYPGADGIP